MPKAVFFCFFVWIAFAACRKGDLQLDAEEITLPVDDRLNAITFFSSQIGFVAGGKQFERPALFRTQNGGLTWKEVSLAGSERKEIYGCTISPNGHMITVGYGGTIYISSDTGQSFRYVQHQSWKELKDVAILSDTLSFIVGGTGFNKGHISSFLPDGSGSNQLGEERNYELTAIEFTDSLVGYIAAYGAILKTTDAGKTWAFTSAEHDYFKAMSWINKDEGIVVGYEGSILKTINAGETWKRVRNGNNLLQKKLRFYAVAGNRRGKWIAVGEKGACLHSNDDGETWAETEKFTSNDLRAVAFQDEHTCYVAGDQGTLFRIRL
jgi:photosystem II stability/assembly factor-like uncharacterized protein